MRKRSYHPRDKFEILPTWARALLQSMAEDINELGAQLAYEREINQQQQLLLEKLQSAA